MPKANLEVKEALRLIRKLERRVKKSLAHRDSALAELAEARRAIQEGRWEWAELFIRDVKEALQWANR